MSNVLQRLMTEPLLNQPRDRTSLDNHLPDMPRPSSAVEILAAAAHELRLPLSHINGFVTSLRRTDVNWDEETRSEFIAEVDRETDRFAELIDSMLAARAPDGSYRQGPDLAITKPVSVVQGALHRIGGLLGQRPSQLDVPASLPPLYMDASQMQRPLANLLQNAIKYSPESTAIGISARITDDGELELSVDDEGPGTSAEERERVFDPFFRMRTADQSEVSGHGLGLAIC
jgi:two-component system, OmpR family, sensor histidine kinase KdpD